MVTAVGSYFRDMLPSVFLEVQLTAWPLYRYPFHLQKVAATGVFKPNLLVFRA